MSARQVTSLTNPTVKAVRALHMRKEREESGLFLAEGLKLVGEAVDQGRTPRILLYGPEAAGMPVLRRVAEATEKAGGDVVEVNREILEKVSRRDNPQTVIAVFPQLFHDLMALKPKAARCWVALQAVRDPGNLGTIVRTADAAGCGGVILVGDCCDPYSVEAVRATMGSIFAVPLYKATVAEFLAWRAHWPGSVVGTLLTATIDHRQARYEDPTLILMGNEQAGLPPELAAACDVNVKIPMRGRADSLNLSVATGIMIYAATP
ncbi:TrmH family RNA methyltransferase [Phenylobacterium montanum]|uniref:RNA methyltransferase n=1 Tax=Phenylobacterium montanum TaxID=2823693 RepID=A0A975IVI4_9CAUL|nr:RNA methyltransferase [Caulobacter sp. S6]QUD89042.1 RNA methyltransferase [Caulobacter sp. S6]